ncbi:MAG: glycosyltransferase family 39 protein [Candidatus Omnitrophota bacterium]|nr:glycosyltransferase family 39 protein [Candidatus Omnitrophota bacterium]
MFKILEKPIIVILLLLLLSGYLYFSQMGKFALTDPDETFYAQTAKEMVEKGEWLTPYLYGKPQFEKPILFYWLVEASYKVFGINEFAARFPSGLFGFIGLAAIYLLGRLLFNNRVGIFSAIVLATNVEYVILANACVTDMLLSTCMLLGVLFFFYGQIRKKGYFYVLSAAALGLSVLTKGPIGLLLPGFIIFVYMMFVRDFTLFKKFKVIAWSSLVFMLIALPWYIVMYKSHANTFMDEFFGFHNITRFLTPEHKTGSEIYYNIPVIFGGFFPWSAFLPLGAWKMLTGIRKPESANRSHSIFMLLWLIVIFIFFTVSSTKLPTYIFPCFISLAVIVGKFWDDFLTRQSERPVIVGMRASYYFLILAVVLGLIGGYIFIKIDSPDILPAAVNAGLFMAFGMGLSFAAFIRKRFLAAFILIACSVGLILYPISKKVLPFVEGYESSKPASRALMAYYKPGDVIGCERDYRPGVAFYTGIIPVFLSNSSNLSEFINKGETVWGVLKKRNITDDSMRVIYQYGKKRVITNSKEELK